MIKQIRVVYCQIVPSDFDETKGVKRILEDRLVDYDETTTLEDCFRGLGIYDVNENVSTYTDAGFLSAGFDSSNNWKMYVKKVVHDEKLYWHVDFNECLLSDLINDYGLEEITFYKPGGFGGHGATTSFNIDWSILLTCINAFLLVIGNFNDIYEFPKNVKEFKEILKNIFIDHKNGEVTAYEFKEELRKETVWAIDKLRYRFNLSGFSELGTIFLMRLFGYLYDERTKLFFYSADLEEMNLELARSIYEEANEKLMRSYSVEIGDKDE